MEIRAHCEWIVVHAGWNKWKAGQHLLRIGNMNLTLVYGRILSPEPVRNNRSALAHAQLQPVQRLLVTVVC